MAGDARRRQRGPCRRGQRVQRQLQASAHRELRRRPALAAQRAQGVGRHRADRDRSRARPGHRCTPHALAWTRSSPAWPQRLTCRSCSSPYALDGAGQIAPSGRVAFADVTFDVPSNKVSVAAAKRFVSMVTSTAGGGVQFEVEGQIATEGDTSGGTSGVALGFLAAGSGALRGVRVAARDAAAAADRRRVARDRRSRSSGCCRTSSVMNSFSGQLALLIGLGVGVDYALFIVTRYRQGRPARSDGRAGGDRVARHVRARGHVRRDHRLRRDARHVRARRQLPLRRRGRRSDHGLVHDARRADADARLCSGSSERSCFAGASVARCATAGSPTATSRPRGRAGLDRCNAGPRRSPPSEPAP